MSYLNTGNLFSTKDTLKDAVSGVMETSKREENARNKVLGEMGVTSINALPHEKLAEYSNRYSKVLNEEWEADKEGKPVVDPKKKGMWAGWSKAELEKELAKAKAGKPHKGTIKEIEFAIRAKSGWGKVDEGNLQELSKETLKSYRKKAVDSYETTHMSPKKAFKRDDSIKKVDKKINESLSPNASAGDYVKDFVHSKNDKFKGDSKKERIKRALGAYYGKKD